MGIYLALHIYQKPFNCDRAPRVPETVNGVPGLKQRSRSSHKTGESARDHGRVTRSYSPRLEWKFVHIGVVLRTCGIMVC
jgi:hypothetical protein